MKTALLTALLLSLLTVAPAHAEPEAAKESDEPADHSIRFFEEGMSRFETWIGAPHKTVQGLPEGTPLSPNGTKGEPIGLGNTKNVFSMIQEDGRPVLKITGEIYGGINTTESFADYHLSVDFKWGEKKWEPRLEDKRDSGLLYHCYGEHGSFWNAWKSCLEFQVQEKDMGDFIGLAGPKAKVRVSPAGSNKKSNRYDPKSETIKLLKGYTHASSEPDLPNGQWNKLELYVVGDRAVHVVNGVIVFALFDAIDGEGKRLDRGQIQIQSEAAECYYRAMVLTPIKHVAVPDEVADLLENP